MFDLNEIKQRSESRSYQLGEKLYYLGKVSRLSVTADSATAIVSGQHDYPLLVLVINNKLMFQYAFYFYKFNQFYEF